MHKVSRVVSAFMIALVAIVGLQVISQGSANATVYSGAVTRNCDPDMCVSTQVHLQTGVVNGQRVIQAIKWVWCFQPGTTNGYQKCRRIVDNKLSLSHNGIVFITVTGRGCDYIDCPASRIAISTDFYGIIAGRTYLGRGTGYFTPTFNQFFASSSSPSFVG